MTYTATTDLIGTVTEDLAIDGWAPRWAACTNAMSDECGNHVSLYEDDESIKVVFEYALGGIVETMYLDPNHGTHRIAVVIEALAAAPVE